MIIMNHKDRLQSLWFYNCLPILKKNRDTNIYNFIYEF